MDAVVQQKGLDLSKETIGTIVGSDQASAATAAANDDKRNVIRITNAVAQYDVSDSNPNALANMRKALGGCVDRDDFTYYDPEQKKEVRLGDVLSAADLTNPNEIVLAHQDSAGRGVLGRILCSADYIIHNPVKWVAMKALGLIADPELIYSQKVAQVLAQLDREGLFGPPGKSTFNLDDWEIGTRAAWRDVVIRRAPEKVEVTMPSLDQAFFGSFRAVAA